jgi:glycosyltransferase involved in cell wall biosynthesis
MKFSVVTPSFNQAAFIGRTLASVATQTGVAIEHRVYDGGSTDGTVEILEQAGASITWSSGRDAGQADAVNKGLRGADGDVIAWLNSDDVYYPGAFERVARFVEANPQVDVVYGAADHIDTGDRVIEPYPVEPWSLARLEERSFICQPAAFFRRRVVDRHGLLDPRLCYCMDYEYWLRLGRAGATFAYLPEKLAGSRLHPGTKTLGQTVAVHAEINDMLKRTLGRVPRRWLVNYVYAEVRDRHGPGQPWLIEKARVLASMPAAARRWA